MYEDKDLQRLYDEKYFATRQRPTMWKRRAEFIIEKFNSKTALDIGCSWGELVKSLNDLNVSAFGIDGSDFAILHVDHTIKNKVFKVNLNSDRFPFDDGIFDIITGFYVIEHIHNIQFFANELYRTLKNNGTVWFLTPNSGPEGRTVVDVFTNKFEDWKKIFEEYNFNVKKFSPHEMLTLKGKLGKFKFYKLPKSLQNVVKRVAYDIANKKDMKDTSFILTKN
ncbi:MAG: class I SAM-dependent methyltransferase [Nitrososphaeraceae archaeon]